MYQIKTTIKNLSYRSLAFIIFLIHTVIVIIILFGWYYPEFKIIHLVTVILTLFSEIKLGYCILTKWEFALMKNVDSELNYDSSFLSYYAHKLFNINVPARKIKYPAIVVLVFVLILNFVH